MTKPALMSGPMRHCSIGAALLDLEDPSIVIAYAVSDSYCAFASCDLDALLAALVE